MATTTARRESDKTRVGRDATLAERLKTRFEAQNLLRKGVCLLNVGAYDRAAEAFEQALQRGGCEQSLTAYIASCHIARGDPAAAANRLAIDHEGKRADATRCIRHALALWAAGMQQEAIASLRQAVQQHRESAELQFQLGTLLADMGELEEAELRFTQAANMDRGHTEALVSLALCCGAREAPEEAVKILQKAQARRPHDAKIGQLLTYAARAANQAGKAVQVRASMPDDAQAAEETDLATLGAIVEQDPEFVDAFLRIPQGEVSPEVYAILLRTFQQAAELHPDQAGIHFRCGQLLQRLGRPHDAIAATERAVSLNNRYTQALIALGHLYRDTDQNESATARLEQAVNAGAKYPDVYYLLGNLYRERGMITKARSAYRRALCRNADFAPAQQALAELRV